MSRSPRRLLALVVCTLAAPLLFGTATAAAQTFDDPAGDVLPCSGECSTHDQDLRRVTVESSGGQVSFTIEQYGPFTDPIVCRCFFPQLHIYLDSTTPAQPDYYTSVFSAPYPYAIRLFDRSLSQTGIGVNNCPIPGGFNGVGMVGGDPLVVVNDRTITYSFDLATIGNPGSFDWRVAEPGASTCQTTGNPEPNPRDVVPGTGLASFGGGSTGGVAATVTAPKSLELNGSKVVVPIDIAADEGVTAKGIGDIKINPTYKLKPKTIQIPAGQTKTLKLKPKKKAQAKKIAKALKQGDKATAKLTVKLTDDGGSTEKEKLKVKLKR